MQRVHASVLSLALAALAGVLGLAAPGATASRAAGVHATPLTAGSYPLATIPVKPGSSQPRAYASTGGGATSKATAAAGC
jgi:hypothetical protein